MEYTIYKITCSDENIGFVYIGSTRDFTRRKYCHKSNCNNETNISYNISLYKKIREHGGFENWNMKPIEILICDKREAHIRENYHMDINKEQKEILNMNKASLGITYKEYQKQWRTANNEYQKVYYTENKEQLKQYQRDYYLKNKI